METLCLWVYMLLLLVQYTTGFSLLKNNSTINHLCHEHESNLLLQLKQELPPYTDLYYKTQYWNGSSDCCLWDGVTCDHFTGHVIALDLSYNDVFGPVISSTYLVGNLQSNSSLFHLTHLRSLNLAFNDFNGSAILPEFGRLNALTYLNLSEADFAGELPMEFYHLSNLLSLDLAAEGFPWSNNKIRCEVNMLFANMTRLRTLVLRGQSLNSELPMNVSTFLTHLDLGSTGLHGNLPANIFEIPSLQFLRLNDNPGLKGSFPKSLNWSNVHSLQKLDLSETSISGRLPDSIGFMSSLNHLSLYSCRFSGPIPESIGNITAITHFDLSDNEFSGRIPDVVWGFPNVDLSYNNLEGRIPSFLTNMSRLEYLAIGSNALTGPFPSSAGHGLQKLRFMDLSNNSIQGMIPPWLFSLPSLEWLDLSSNRLTGRIGKLNSKTLSFLELSSNRLNIELQSFYNLSSIESLSISHNTVTEHDGNTVNVTFLNLTKLAMSYCEIKEFPNFLRSNMPVLYDLDLSYNSLTYVGDLPSHSLSDLNLHSNSLRGKFPSSICNMNGLITLILSHNKLSGHIPECLANVSTHLWVLDLRRNEFYGKIPSIGAMHNLIYLGLNGNRLEGILPPSLANCTNLEVIDLGNNIIHDTFPWWLHNLPWLKILILKSNSFHGSITSPAFTNNSFSNMHILDVSYNNFTGRLPENLLSCLDALKNQIQASPDDGLYMGTLTGVEYSMTLSVKGEDEELTKVLKIFTTVDLSSNNFNGSIPESLSNLTSLRLLNLSHNSFHGNIPPSLGHMTNLEQLDLSSNQLTGGIPQTLTNLTFLGALDLSHNHLVGPIPQGNQFLTFSNESYVGNSGLCGAPLTKSCGNEKEPLSPGGLEEEEDDDDGFMMGFTWKVVVLGYGCGIVFGFILGSVMMSMEKPKWLVRFVYVEAAIILSRQKKRRRVVLRRW